MLIYIFILTDNKRGSSNKVNISRFSSVKPNDSMRLNTCPDVLTRTCDTNPCNCPDQRYMPKYKKKIQVDGVYRECSYCGKICVTETAEPNAIVSENINPNGIHVLETHILNDVESPTPNTITYTPKYAYLKGEDRDCVCLNNAAPIEKNIVVKNERGDGYIDKTAYICGTGVGGSRKHIQNDVTATILNKLTEAKAYKLDAITVKQVTQHDVILADDPNSQSSKDLTRDVTTAIDVIGGGDASKLLNTASDNICPYTSFAPYFNTDGKWVIDSGYPFSDKRYNPVACNDKSVCTCSGDRMFWKFKKADKNVVECITCGKLICPNDESIKVFQNKNKSTGVTSLINCTEIMYNGLSNGNVNKCQCNEGRSLKRSSYAFNGKSYMCDTCEKIVNMCPSDVTTDGLNNNISCTTDKTCTCPTTNEGWSLDKYSVLYYAPNGANVSMTSGPDKKYLSCYTCGLPIKSSIYNICDDSIPCEIPSDLQELINSIEDVVDNAEPVDMLQALSNANILEDIAKYVTQDSAGRFSKTSLSELEYNCLPKSTISNLFADILLGKSLNYIKTSLSLVKRTSCNSIAGMSSELETGEGVNCRYNVDENKLFSIMGHLVLDADYKAYKNSKTQPKDKKLLSNVISYYSKDLIDFNNTLRNCGTTCSKDYVKHFKSENFPEDIYPKPSCEYYAKLFCPSNDTISDNDYSFSKRVKDFCKNKDSKCNAYTYIKDGNNEYLNNNVKNVCPASCWKCDDYAINSARTFIEYTYPDGKITPEEEQRIIKEYVDEFKKLKSDIHVGQDVMVDTGAFTKYVDTLKFDIRDMGNRWSFAYDKGDKDKNLNEMCTPASSAGDVGRGLSLLNAGCHIVSDAKAIPAKFRSSKNEIIPGLHAYCNRPENSMWMKSIKEKCATSPPDTPSCSNVDHSNSFPFKLEGSKKCFGSVDISRGSEGLVECIDKVLVDACIGDVRNAEDVYSAECRGNFEKCVQLRSCGAYNDGTYDYTTIDDRYKSKPFCRKCMDDAFNCTTLSKMRNPPVTPNEYRRDDGRDSLLYTLKGCEKYLNTSACKAPADGSLNFGFWVDDKMSIIPETENEFKWYISNWWKGYPDENKYCKGRWVLKYNNVYCDTKNCTLTDMSFHIKISDDINGITAAAVKGLAEHLKTAINEYVYQQYIGSYSHINALLAKIIWATKYKADPNPECGTVYDKHLFNDLIIVINKLNSDIIFMSGIPLNYRNYIDVMLKRMAKVRPERPVCTSNNKLYLTGDNKIANNDMGYLQSSRQFLFFNNVDINDMLNVNNPNSVYSNVTVIDNGATAPLTFKIEYRNITIAVAEMIKNIFNTQNLLQYDSLVNNNSFIKYLFATFNVLDSTSRYTPIFKNLLTPKQIDSTKITLIDTFVLGTQTGNTSGNYIWLYEKEASTQSMDCNKAKMRGFTGAFTDLNIDIQRGMTYSGMVPCTKNTALFFEENKCKLQQLTSQRRIPCTNDIATRERVNDPTITTVCEPSKAVVF